MPLAGTQAQCAFPIGLGNGLEALLGGADDGGQDHDDQRQTAGQDARSQAQLLDEEQHAHQAEDDGGDARQRLGGKLNDLHHLAVGGVLRQIDGGANAQGQHDDHGHHDDIDGVEDVGQDADGILDIAGLRGQQLPGDVAKTTIEDIADEENQQRAGDAGADPQQDPQAAVIDPAPGRKGMFHGAQSSFFFLMNTSSSTLMSMMNKNSTRPMEYSAWRCRLP